MLTDEQVRLNVATNLNDLLEEKGWTQTQLSEATGDPISTISALCRGRSIPKAGILGRVAEVLRVNVDRLIDSPPEKSLRRAS